MEIHDFLDEDASDSELAACGLVMELLSTAGTLTLQAQLRMLELQSADCPEEDALLAVTRRYMELAVPTLAAKGIKPCLRAAGLIETIRDLITDGMEWETAGQTPLN